MNIGYMRKSHKRVRRNKRTMKKYRVGGYVSGARKHPRLTTKTNSKNKTMFGGKTSSIENRIVHI